MNAAATLIQRVFRAYMVRAYVKRMREAGLKITNVARGFLARLEWRRILMEIEMQNRPHVTIEAEVKTEESEDEYGYEEEYDDDLPDVIQYGVPTSPHNVTDDF